MLTEAELEACATVADPARHPFLKAAAARPLPKESWRIYAGRIHYTAARHLSGLARLLALCPDGDLRLFLLDNYLEEDGIHIRDGEMIRTPGASHTELARRFTRACGIPDNDLDAPDCRVSSSWLETAMSEGRWAAALGYVCVGMELNVPGIFAPLSKALCDVHGFSAEEILFFSHHVVADEEHGAVGLRLLTEAAAKGLATSEEICAGARKGAAAWWGFHLACVRDMKRAAA